MFLKCRSRAPRVYFLSCCEEQPVSETSQITGLRSGRFDRSLGAVCLANLNGYTVNTALHLGVHVSFRGTLPTKDAVGRSSAIRRKRKYVLRDPPNSGNPGSADQERTPDPVNRSM